MIVLDWLIWTWYLWVSFLMPVWIGRRMAAALREPNRPRTWRLGKGMFFVGILVWAPYVLFARLLGMGFPVWPVLTIHLVFLYGGLLVQKLAGQKAPEEA